MALTHRSLVESAALVGRIRWVELVAFERLGRRARACEQPRVASYLSGASLAHAWRARLLEDHLPVSAGLPGPEELTVSPNRAVEEALDLLDPAPGTEDGRSPTSDEELLGGLVLALYPAMLAGYERHLADTSPASDPPLARSLRRARDDLSAVLAEGRRLPTPTAGNGALLLHERLARLLPGRSAFDPSEHGT